MISYFVHVILQSTWGLDRLANMHKPIESLIYVGLLWINEHLVQIAIEVSSFVLRSAENWDREKGFRPHPMLLTC